MRNFSGLLLSLTLASGLACAQSSPPLRIQGDVLELRGNSLSIRSAAGEALLLKLGDPLRVLTISQASFAAIQPGSYVAVTAVPQADGSLLASRVNIVPESMRGVGEGHRPMAALPGNTMTNATVATIAGSGGAGGNTMTNATVTNVGDATQTGKLTVQYKGGEKQVTVPVGLPIMLLEPGDRALLVPGTHLVVSATRSDDGGLTATSITTGKGGTMPPL